MAVAKRPKALSEGEEELALWLRSSKQIPPPQREYRFHATRRWLFDFAWPAHRFAVEVEGITGNPNVGRHQTAAGMREDLKKYHAAHMLGWKVYRCSHAMISSGAVLEAIELELIGVSVC